MKMTVLKRTDGSIFIHTDTGINEITHGHSIEQWQPIEDAVNIHEELIEGLKKGIDRLDSLIIEKLGNSVFDKELNELKQLLKKANEQ